jgi:hypothetical protein
MDAGIAWLRISFALILLCAAPSATAGSPPAGYPDWDRLSDVEVIEVITRDEDGDLRETKVWFVLIDGEAYLRTSRSRWLENLRREPAFGLRIDGVEYRAEALEATTPALIERVDAASAEKYGWQESFIHVFRIRDPDILKIVPVRQDD